jgi:MarR family transcriptional regulator, 2-MHQ and catechol-resistance regulon repressor
MTTVKRSNSETNPDTRGVHLWLVLWKAAHMVESHAHRSVAAQGMGLSDFGVLEALLHKGPLPIKDLGAKVLLTSGSITTAVDRLEKRGLVERIGDSNDRRSRIVRLTPEGRNTIRRAFAEHRQAMEQVASVLDAKDRASLIDLLRRLGRDAEMKLGKGSQRSQDGRARKRTKEETWQ